MKSKSKIIQEINKIIALHGKFTVADVDAESSPILDCKGKLSHLAEEFLEGQCVVYVYDPSSHSSDEIDTYDEFYERFDKDQLEYILDLACTWSEKRTEILIDDVIEEIKKGIMLGDITVLAEILSNVSVEILIASIPEKNILN